METKNLLVAALEENAKDFEDVFESLLERKLEVAIQEKCEKMFESQSLHEQYIELVEKLVVFNGGAKYGQIVFMSGGAGSGKGFASSTFMEGEKFKIRDVDEWKKAYLKLAQLKGRNPELKDLNLKNPNDVFTLHKFVKSKGIKDKTLNLLLNDARADRLPNIIFDITGKELSDFSDVIPKLKEAGYDPKNIHLAWVLTDFKVSYSANLTRERVVPADVFLDTHRGAAKTMQGIINGGKLPFDMNGRFVVILNNRENTVFFKAGDTYKGKTIPKDTKGVKDFYYINIKDAGKRQFHDESKWKEELHKQIVSNIPGGQDTVDSLRADAIERLSGKDDKKSREGIRLVNRDIEDDKKRAKEKIEKIQNKA